MPFKNNILVVINTHIDEQVALDKAIRLSEHLGTSITALVRRKHAIPKLLATLDSKLSIAVEKGIDVNVEISDDSNWFRAVMREMHKTKYDLIVKEPHDPSLKDHVFLREDWKLLRSSSVPVLLVHADNSWLEGPLLLCVNGDTVDREHQALNEKILTAGRFLGKASGGQINLVSSYPSEMQVATNKARAPQLLEAQYRNCCRRMVAGDQVTDDHIHVDAGPAELLIPQVGEKLGAKLVIMGTVARSGLKGILLGNTAELILERLKTDVLVLPPEN